MAELWAPTLAEVADCIPSKTVNVSLPGSEDPIGTFTDDTRPTGVQAQRHVDSAVSSVLGFAPTIPTALEPVAKSAAKWRAAADIWLSYPDRDADITSAYAALDARARLEWDKFTNAAGDQGVSTDTSTVPYWNFEEAPEWADRIDL
jgi:hypothetical protein